MGQTKRTHFTTLPYTSTPLITTRLFEENNTGPGPISDVTGDPTFSFFSLPLPVLVLASGIRLDYISLLSTLWVSDGFGAGHGVYGGICHLSRPDEAYTSAIFLYSFFFFFHFLDDMKSLGGFSLLAASSVPGRLCWRFFVSSSS